MHESMSLYLTVEDPEGTAPVQDAFCVLTEVHMNFKTQSLVGIFECWRSYEAFQAQKRSFTAIQVQYERDKGGAEYFAQHGIDGAGLQLGPKLRDFCMQHSEILSQGTAANGENVEPG